MATNAPPSLSPELAMDAINRVTMDMARRVELAALYEENQRAFWKVMLPVVDAQQDEIACN